MEGLRSCPLHYSPGSPWEGRAGQGGPTPWLACRALLLQNNAGESPFRLGLLKLGTVDILSQRLLCCGRLLWVCSEHLWPLFTRCQYHQKQQNPVVMRRSTKLFTVAEGLCSLAPWNPLQSPPDQLPLACVHLAPPTTVIRALLIVTVKHSQTPTPMPQPSLTTQVTSSGCLVYIITLVPCALASHCLSKIK